MVCEPVPDQNSLKNIIPDRLQQTWAALICPVQLHQGVHLEMWWYVGHCHNLSVSLSWFGVLPVFTLVSVLFLPMSSFPPVWLLLPPLMCFSCYSLRALCVWYLSHCLSFVPRWIILVCDEFCPVCYLCSLPFWVNKLLFYLNCLLLGPTCLPATR